MKQLLTLISVILFPTILTASIALGNCNTPQIDKSFLKPYETEKIKWEIHDPHFYDDKKLGLSIKFKTDDTTVDFYVYDFGKSQITKEDQDTQLRNGVSEMIYVLKKFEPSTTYSSPMLLPEKTFLDSKNLIQEAVFILKKGQKSIKSDTSKILTNTNKMMSEINEIKSLTKDTNESIEKSISKIISSVEKNHDFNTIEDYIPKVTEWFKFWDKIEENTKTFMPGSEWLYDNIKSSDFQDFSPFVLYYCRALENELLKKIFLSFHDHVNEMNDDELKSLFVWNKEGLNEKKLKEYQIFFNQFKTNILKNRKKYTLGDMRLILNLLPNSKNKKGSIRYNISPLLKELNKFIKNKIGGIESETIKRLENLIINYRNKSAHVDIIEEEKALIFYNEFKIIMNKLIGKF